MVTPIEIHYRIDELDSPEHKIVVVEFNGELDESNIDEAAKEVYQIIEESEDGLWFVFDFENLGYLNSKSIGYLSDWYTKINEKSAQLVIASPRENIVDILSTVGLDNFVKMYHSMNEAKLEILSQVRRK